MIAGGSGCPGPEAAPPPGDLRERNLRANSFGGSRARRVAAWIAALLVENGLAVVVLGDGCERERPAVAAGCPCRSPGSCQRSPLLGPAPAMEPRRRSRQVPGSRGLVAVCWILHPGRRGEGCSRLAVRPAYPVCRHHNGKPPPKPHHDATGEMIFLTLARCGVSQPTARTT